MSATPRTDIMATGNSDPQADEYEDLLAFTRQLERELAEATEPRTVKELIEHETIKDLPAKAINDILVKMHADLAEAKKDTARLDWLLEQGRKNLGNATREAIDAAIGGAE